MKFDINTYNLIHQYDIKNRIKLQNPNRNPRGFIPTFGFSAILPSLGSGRPPPWAVEANGSRGRNHLWTVLRGCASLASGLSLICSIIYMYTDVLIIHSYHLSGGCPYIIYMPWSRVGYHGPCRPKPPAADCSNAAPRVRASRARRWRKVRCSEDFRRSSDDAIGRGGTMWKQGFHPQFGGDHLKSNSKVITSDNPIQPCWQPNSPRC